MTALDVTDASSHRQEKIANAGRVVGRSLIRQRFFEAVCRGKRRVKSVGDLGDRAGLTYMQVRKAGIVLVDEGLIETEKVGGALAYRKIPFYARNWRTILRLARAAGDTTEGRTSRAAGREGPIIALSRGREPPRPRVGAIRLSVDDVESFSRVRAIRHGIAPRPLLERVFKRGLQTTLGETGNFPDWGGETDDLFSTRLTVRGTRVAVAFALKGPGTKGRLTLRKMGKNGDQVVRLFRSPADAFFVQYWGQIDQALVETMEKLAREKALTQGNLIYYGVIDGTDSTRLVRAYAYAFRR